MIESRFLAACRRQTTDATPVWFMRQAGRYMADYRAIREKFSLLEIVKQPELAAEVTLQPVRAFHVDAAILFADILLPLQPMGLDFEFAKGEGPVIHNPVRTQADVDALRPLHPEETLVHVMDAICLLRTELGNTPLIGFCGAPFTVASYMIEGGASRDYKTTKLMMYSAPKIWHALMDKLSTALAEYLTAQIHSGAQAVQLFDSWVGALSPMDYERFVLPYSKKVLEAAQATGVPVIHFGTGTATLLPLMRQAGGDVIGLDWRVPLELGWQAIGYDRAVQGNLDPVALLAPIPEMKKHILDVLRRAEGRPGHIFNLGHGILQQTPEENIRAAVEIVHAWRAG
ncbi:MAG: uroporphyrinogen decarboxylase [Chloroflexi bacterium GWB2_49_20]|nr:MAG: uroporphyrinogen decarboxylase [Chloroflexi bacterium GWB2_49_20]OGN77970.1 MAG: uroporphyrinogen decarboxylase [Chloroflexi bacterium GWC2_49_37]OGN85008.1 MAG: uroporphyrinogen decarboxylase [Chloroflexi bacterium GWD2_49_16]HBG74961.1 uroporphyrinogen decarboxylase [Anaerolineae bacterium]HCC78315.1 uroporphyrinogen decarboxylase [Anaerolineae bacterium]